jgi:hypothetical protein
VSNILIQLRNTFLQVRKLLKLMGIQAEVEVEPDSQSNLIDSTMEVYFTFIFLFNNHINRYLVF